MKHSIAVKFIAIILCAAALMGVAASGGGIALLADRGLYAKTPAQLRQENNQTRGLMFAVGKARQYASRELGGCPDDMLAYSKELVVPNWFREGSYGFTLMDSDGNELWSDGIPVGGAAEVFTFSEITGKYRHLVSVEPTGQAAAEDTVIACTHISTEDSGVQFAEAEQTHQLSFTLVPENTTDEVIFASLDETVAIVDQTGLITAVGNGITAIRITCGPHFVDYPVSCQLAEPTEATLAETEPETQPTEEFVYDAWSDEDWERIQSWIQEEWSKDKWTKDQWEDMAAWVTANWNEEEWTDDQWAQLRHWIEDEWDPEEPAAAEEPTVPETTAATEPAVDLRELEEESRRLEAERETIPETVTVNGRPVTDYQIYRETYYDSTIQQEVMAEYVMLDMPGYTLELRLLPGAVYEDRFMPLLEGLWLYRQLLIPVLICCLLLFAALAVYLVSAAGHKSKSDEVRAGGLNRMPLELYFGVVFFACALGVSVISEIARFRLDQMPLELYLAVSGGILYGCSLLAVGFLFAMAAQFKTHIWFRQSLLGLCWRVLLWVWGKCTGLLPIFLRWIKGVWNWIAGIVRFVYVRFARLFAMLPMVWQWLIIGLGMLLFLIVAMNIGEFSVFLAICTYILVILYGAYAFGRLLDGTKRMSQGDLDTHIEDKHLLGGFRVFAQNLNALAGTAKAAAMKQLKSERMKTELITNVSHDIKTPLTSIVSYVDLLQKPHTPEEEQQYLEVLNRQSLQLKQLIEDLIEMSKASTGNMTVDIDLVDAVESVNQALGEFADKLDKVMLTPVFRHSEDTLPMMADGRLTWRVLHNLLSNAVKYALPGTRLYIDLMEVEGKVILSMKNVSREELNVDAEELMERFVRGDDARNTEGSGLGLNIAKSMMELQKGQLQLLVDGDLFKVTLIFPGA